MRKCVFASSYNYNARRFTKNDWYAWGGAEEFDDGSDPYIAELVLDDGTVLDILSTVNGIEIDVIDEYDMDYSFGDCVSGDCHRTPAQALLELHRVCKLISDKFDTFYDLKRHLKAIGFEQY